MKRTPRTNLAKCAGCLHLFTPNCDPANTLMLWCDALLPNGYEVEICPQCATLTHASEEAFSEVFENVYLAYRPKLDAMSVLARQVREGAA